MLPYLKPVPAAMVALFIHVSPAFGAPPAARVADPVEKPDLSSPLKCWRTFLLATKVDDLALAKQCLAVTPEDPQLLEFSAGLWIAHHRFNNIVTKRFGKREESPYIRPDCSDEAIDRTLEKIGKASVTITGDMAEVKVDWGDCDDAKPWFSFPGDEPVKFRKVKGQWKMSCAMEEPAEQVFAPGTMGWAMREEMKLLSNTCGLIESGKLGTWEQVVTHLEKQSEVLAKQYEKGHKAPGLELKK